MDKKDIALESASSIAKLLSITEPAAATLGMVVDFVRQRRTDRQTKNLSSLCRSLERRVAKLEEEGVV